MKYFLVSCRIIYGVFPKKTLVDVIRGCSGSSGFPVPVHECDRNDWLRCALSCGLDICTSFFAQLTLPGSTLLLWLLLVLVVLLLVLLVLVLLVVVLVVLIVLVLLMPRHSSQPLM